MLRHFKIDCALEAEGIILIRTNLKAKLPAESLPVAITHSWRAQGGDQRNMWEKGVDVVFDNGCDLRDFVLIELLKLFAALVQITEILIRRVFNLFRVQLIECAVVPSILHFEGWGR